MFMGARMRRARLAEPTRFDDSVENARAVSLGNYLNLGQNNFHRMRAQRIC
jgi:hypothetical protein